MDDRQPDAGALDRIVGLALTPVERLEHPRCIGRRHAGALVGHLDARGVALLRALSSVKSIKTQNDDQKTGVEIVRKAIMAPARQIVDNAGDDGAVVIGKLLESKDYSFGYNAQTGEYGDMVKSGIIDPAKVVRTAIQDAASIAGLLITTEAMIAELPKKDAPMPPMGGGGMGGMDF